MGACVSSNRKSAAMNSNKQPHHHLLIIPSHILKQKPPIINGNVLVKPQCSPLHSPDFGGSKEETFYDSQAWLESDCEDEFMSVNGEFTPSRGNTPVHHEFRATIPPIKGGTPTVEDQEPSFSPSGTPSSLSKKKKRLSELFKESLRDNNHEGNGEQDDENGVVNGSAAVRGGLKPKREKWAERPETVHLHNCLPRMLSSCRPVTPQQTEERRK